MNNESQLFSNVINYKLIGCLMIIKNFVKTFSQHFTALFTLSLATEYRLNNLLLADITELFNGPVFLTSKYFTFTREQYYNLY